MNSSIDASSCSVIVASYIVIMDATMTEQEEASMLLFINLRLPLRDTGREGLPQTDRILTALQVRLLPQEAEALTTICRLT